MLEAGEQAELLRKSVPEWNVWRSNNSKLPIDFTEANFIGAKISKANLRTVNLSGANLRNANLRGTNLRYANLSGADLRFADLTGADLRSADLRVADLSGANLGRANLNYANFSGADLQAANLGKVKVAPLGPNLMQIGLAKIKSIFIRQPTLKATLAAGFKGIFVDQASFKETDLRLADLRDADLCGADLRKSRLKGANLRRANLTVAKLGAPLFTISNRNIPIRENLSKTDLREADLTGANLKGLNLSGIDLSDADLGGADLDEAHLGTVNLCNANLHEADLSRTNLTRANLDRAILGGCYLNRSILPMSCHKVALNDVNIVPSRSFTYRTLAKIHGSIDWSLVRKVGSLRILTMVSYVALLLVPLIAGVWPATRTTLNHYSEELLRSSVSIHHEVIDLVENAESSPSELPLIWKQQINDKVMLLKRKVKEITTELNETKIKNREMPFGIAAAFFAALFVALGHLLYELFADSSVKAKIRNEYSRVALEAFDETRPDSNKRLLEALHHIRQIARLRPFNRHSNLVRQTGRVVWVPTEIKDIASPREFENEICDDRNEFPNQNIEYFIPESERKLIIIEEGAKAEYDFLASEKRLFAYAAVSFYILSTIPIVSILCVQIFNISCAAGWSLLNLVNECIN